MRVNLEGKGQAVDGDVTTTGAVCIATGAGYLDEGRMVLREGDHAMPSLWAGGNCRRRCGSLYFRWPAGGYGWCVGCLWLFAGHQPGSRALV